MIKADFARKLKEKVDAVGGGGQAKAGTRKVRKAFFVLFSTNGPSAGSVWGSA
jgi:hypothetical protein